MPQLILNQLKWLDHVVKGKVSKKEVFILMNKYIAASSIVKLPLKGDGL